jgi:hypothetical protein
VGSNQFQAVFAKSKNEKEIEILESLILGYILLILETYIKLKGI